MVKSVRQLLIIGRVNHYRYEGRYYSYTPYVREIDIWADLFPEIVIASTLREEKPPGDCSAFSRPNIRVVPVAEVVDASLAGRLIQLVRLPKMIWQLIRYMKQADAIHVRCPADLGLLGILLAPLFGKPLYAKYATLWMGYRGEPTAWRLQRALLRSRWWRGPVTVYGPWPDQPRNVVPFFTSVMTEDQVARARGVRRTFAEPWRVLFVGRLTKSKNADVLLDALATMRTRAEAVIVGDGPERPALEAQAAQLGLQERVTFAGGLGFEQVLEWYEKSHISVLVSEVEGWPKALTEAMAYGLVCVGSDRGLIPWMLGEGRGIVVPPRDAGALAAALEKAVTDSEASSQMAQRAAAWAQKHSLEGLREALRALLEERWK